MTSEATKDNSVTEFLTALKYCPGIPGRICFNVHRTLCKTSVKTQHLFSGHDTIRVRRVGNLFMKQARGSIVMKRMKMIIAPLMLGAVLVGLGSNAAMTSSIIRLELPDPDINIETAVTKQMAIDDYMDDLVYKFF